MALDSAHNETYIFRGPELRAHPGGRAWIEKVFLTLQTPQDDDV
jgi:hypothetical protein